MPRYVDLVGQILPTLRHRLQQAGTAAPVIDEGYVEQCLFEALTTLLDIIDIDAYTIFDASMATTTTGDRTYTLPSNFGRMLTFKHPDETGIRCSDGTTEYDLYYELPLTFARSKSTTNGRPGRFTITTDGLVLDPPPDSNSGGNYTIRGTYIQKLNYDTFLMTDEVYVPDAQHLQEAAMARYLGQDMTPSLARIATAQGRVKVQLAWRYRPERHRRWRRQVRR